MGSSPTLCFFVRDNECVQDCRSTARCAVNSSLTTWIRSFSEATSFAARTVIGSYVNEALGSRTHDVAEAYRLAMAEVPVQLRLGAFMRVFIVDRPRSLLRTKCPGSVAQRQSRCLLNTSAWVRVPPVPLVCLKDREPDLRTMCPIAIPFFISSLLSTLSPLLSISAARPLKSAW